ncbi:MAG TPA: metal-dependent hydrolase [Novosphingobium sp.]
MDNLTHSLVGALLGQMGLKRRTGLAMPTLIIAANIPDVDAGCTVLGMASLAMRRGMTHGPIGILLLPLALTGAMVAFDRWQAGAAPDRPIVLRFGPVGC